MSYTPCLETTSNFVEYENCLIIAEFQVKFAPWMFGVIINVGLLGIMIMQTYLYFLTYKGDKLWLKILVALLFFCDLIESGFDIALLYIPWGTTFTAQQQRSHVNIASTAHAVLSTIIAFSVQAFLAWRIKQLTRSKVIFGFAVTFAFLQICGGIFSAVIVTLSQATDYSPIPLWIWLGSSIITDSIITWALGKHVIKAYKNAPSSRGYNGVNNVILLSFQTGLVTIIWTVAFAIVYTLEAVDILAVDIQWVFNLPLAKIYTVSFISSLNSREILGSHFESRAERRKNSSRTVWGSIRSYWGRMWSTKSQPTPGLLVDMDYELGSSNDVKTLLPSSESSAHSV